MFRLIICEVVFIGAAGCVKVPAEEWPQVSAEEHQGARPDALLTFSPSPPSSSLQPTPASSQILRSTCDSPFNNTKQIDDCEWTNVYKGTQ